MKPQYKISIPKPCHEDWSKMTPNEKGRFCNMCSKTVVDFTQMNTKAIQQYIHNNKENRICGHIKQSQLDTINLRVSETIFQQKMTFHKVFLLALLFTMGTTLFSCSDKNGKIKKIKTVEIVENTVDTIQKDLIKVRTDSMSKMKRPVPKPEKPVVEVTGDIVLIDGGLEIIEVEEGELDVYEIRNDSLMESLDNEDVEEDLEVILGNMELTTSPKFKDTPKNLSVLEQKQFFQKRITEFVNDNFRVPQGYLDLRGKQNIIVDFIIDENGKAKNIRAKGSHPFFENEAKRIIQLLPQFIPLKQNGKPI